jgi:diguanylate cyclase (GGDEF)-like protein
MFNFNKKHNPTDKPVVPFDIYVSLVDALYGDRKSLFIGSLAASLAVLLSAVKTENWILLGFALAIAGVAYARSIEMGRYQKVKATVNTAEAMRRWEIRYVVGATTYVALLGIWSFASFLITDDPFVQILSFSVTLAYMIGVFGRNFASNRLVTSQILGAGIPLTAALLAAGGYYYTIFALVVLPFFSALRLISNRLRGTLLDAVIATREVTQLAMRFDTALNNMPHGLCMFDANRRLVVANKRLADLMQIPSGVVIDQMTSRELLTASGIWPPEPAEDTQQVLAEFEQHIAGAASSMHVDMRQGQILSFTSQPMENGGSVVVVEDITERKVAEARINHLARYDALTGLPNRTFFHDELNHVLATQRHKATSAILFVDLDQFKQVNDTLGHPRGDLLLCAVADRLRGLMRKGDLVARFGGDEFVVLLSPIESAADAGEAAQRIVNTLTGKYEVESHQVIIGASVGIALSPRDGTNSDLLLKNADMALYHAKAAGRAGWTFFQPEMDVKAQARRELELDLRSALQNREFELHFQPILNLKTMRVTTCEALIRWRHPKRGLVPPSEFIPVAEDMGLIVEIGEWVLGQACRDCLTWPSDVGVAVNLSPIQFRRGDIADVVAKALKESGLAPERLEVEITESLLLNDVEAGRAALQRLSALGIRISLDDFGTGYSGLSYLHKFPLHKVKIDRSFLGGLRAGDRSLTLLKGVAKLSAALGLTVVVEGIETEEQLAIVAAEDSIHEAQGYLFSMPIPGRNIREFLMATAPRAAQAATPTKMVAGLRRFGGL